MIFNPYWPFLRLLDDESAVLGWNEQQQLAVSGDLSPYAVRVMLIPGLIDYRKLIETTGTAAADSSSKAHAAGTYSNVTLNDTLFTNGDPAGKYNGTTSFCNIYSAGYNTDWNNAELTFGIWAKVRAASVWTDGLLRAAYNIATDGVSNISVLRKSSSSNIFELSYAAGGVSNVRQVTFSGTGWFHACLTVSLSNNRAIAYLNGIQQGATMTGIGTWAGALASSRVCIGSQTNVPASLWDGWLIHAVLFNRELSAPEVMALAMV